MRGGRAATSPGHSSAFEEITPRVDTVRQDVVLIYDLACVPVVGRFQIVPREVVS